jgi:hypothetical protein|tara:strand:- start:22897 stop:23307 length:411 start_codon:yes stop_codon:yes gene_type:complete
MKNMIDLNKTISAIQQEFQKEYPNLKIEFYKELHSEGEGSMKDHIINGDLTIADITNTNSDKTITPTPEMTVNELENVFAEYFKLGAQVFRKSGIVWLQTTTSDDLTLAEQNQTGDGYKDNDDDEIVDAMDRQELE